MKNGLPGALLSIGLCMCWFVGWTLYITGSGIQAGPHQDYVVISHRVPLAPVALLHADTLYYNDNYVLERGPASAGESFSQPGKFYFNRNPQALFWYFLLMSLSSISLAFVMPLIVKIKAGDRQLGKPGVTAMILAGSILYAVTLFMVDVGNKYIYTPQTIMKDFGVLLRHPHETIYPLLIPFLVVAILCVSGLLLCAQNVLRLGGTAKPDEDTLYAYRRIRNDSNQFLLILGILIASGSVVNTSQLRLALNGAFISHGNFDFLPKELVYIYSLLYTIFIVIIYVPVYFILTNTGKALLEKLNPIDFSRLPEWNARNSVLEEQLQLRTTLQDNLRNALVVISPLLSGILTQLVGK